VPIIRAMIWGVVGAVAGYFAAALGSDVIMGWAGVSNFEGGRGMGAAFVFGPLGGLAGLILGIWFGLRRGGRRPGAGKLAGQGALAVVGLVALVAAGIFLYWESGEHRLTYDGSGANLDFEIRTPIAYQWPADKDVIDIELDAGSSRMSATLPDAWLRHDADWQIMSATIELYLRLSERLLVLRLPDHRDRIFRVRLPAKPDPDAGWSDWYKVDFVGLPDHPQTVSPGSEDPFEIRYKVSVWGQ